MAIFHLSAKPISRGKGQSVIAAAAYRSGERLTDERDGSVKHYKARSERIVFEGIFAPADAPDWARSREQLWNAVEERESRGQGVNPKTARLARELEISLPHEMTDEQREWLIKDFVREQFVRKGYAVDVAIHEPDGTSDARNYHAHLLVTERTIGPEGFAATKDRNINSREQLNDWREEWAHLANRHLERHGLEARIDHRSLEAQGIDREPTKYMGFEVLALAENGIYAPRYLENREIEERNAQRAAARDMDWAERGGMVAQQNAALEEHQRREHQRREQDQASSDARSESVESAKGEMTESRLRSQGSEKNAEKAARVRAREQWQNERAAGRGNLDRDLDGRARD